MNMPEEYECKIAEYNKSLKFSQLPLLSWDIHMQSLDKLSTFKSDINYLTKIKGKFVTNANILKEYIANKAVVVITSPDLVIEFASNNLVNMSGYKPKEVIGKTPKMFQGPKTDSEVAKKIRELVNKQESFEFTLTNYKKDNSLYECHIKGFPVYNKQGNLEKYVAIEKVA